MFSLKTLALYFLVIMSVFVVYSSAAEACVDDEDGHCAVFAELCKDSNFAAYTAKCRKTCELC